MQRLLNMVLSAAAALVFLTGPAYAEPSVEVYKNPS